MTAAAFASIGGTIINVSIPAVKSLLDWLSPARIDPTISKIDALEAKIKDLKEAAKALGDNPIEIEVNRNQIQAATEDLKRLRESQAAYDNLRTRKSEDERRAESEANKIVDEAPGGANAVRGEMIAREKQRLEAAGEIGRIDVQIQATKEKIARETDFRQERFLNEQLERQLASRRGMVDRIAKQAEENVGAIFKPAEAGKVREHIEAMAAAMERIGRVGEARELRNIAPDTEGDMLNKQGEKFEAEWRKEWEKEKEKWNKDAEMLTNQGLEFQGKGFQADRDKEAKELTAQGKAFEGPALKELAEIARGGKSELTADQKTAAQFGKGLQDQVQMFLLEQRRVRAEEAALARQPGGAAKVKARRRNEARRRSQVQREIDQRNRDPMFRRQYRQMSPEQRAALGFQDQMSLNAGSGMGRDAVRNFLDQMLGGALQMAGAPGAGDDERAFRMAGMIQGRAEDANGAMLADGMMNQGNLVEAIAGAQARLAAQMQRFQQQQQRAWDLVNGVSQQVGDMRGNDLNSGTGGF